MIKKKSLEPTGTSSGGFGNSNLKAWAMAVLDFVINLRFSQCYFHEDSFFGRAESLWETLKFTLPCHPPLWSKPQNHF